MNSIRKFKLIDDDERIVGYKRIVTEYITMHERKWTLEPIESDDALVITALPAGFDSLPRAKMPRKNVRVKK